MLTLVASVGLGGCGGNGTSARERPDAGMQAPDASGPMPDSGAGDAWSRPPDAGVDSWPTSCLRDGGGVVGQPAEHRAQVVACMTAAASFGYPDVNVMCGTAADCADAGAVYDLDLKCLEGQCVVDECLADQDCPSGQTCGCADQFSVNVCVAYSCRVDADCGPAGFCSPSQVGCGGGSTGYFCHVPTDTCLNDSDCTCVSGGGICTYEPTVGHWQCERSGGCSD